MQTQQFTLKKLCTLGIVMTCGALAVGCAGNSVKPLSLESQPVATTTESATPLASSETQPVEAKPADSPATVMNDATAPAEQESPAVSEDSITPDTVADAQEPGQKTFYFGFDKTELSEQDQEIIKQHASFLKANPGLVLEINGHTDHNGPHEYNEYLSKQRAESVAKVLIDAGITRSQLVINALADDQPLTDQTTAGKNRRVELQYDEMNMVSSK